MFKQNKIMLRACRSILTTRKYSSSNMAKEIKIITQADVDQFADLTGDHNPIHKITQPNSRRLVHGALLNGLVSGVVATKLPGPGTIIISQEFSFPHKCVVDKQIEIVIHLLENRKIMKISYECVQDGHTVFIGTAKLIAEKK